MIRRIIEVVAYNPQWPARFAQEKNLILGVLSAANIVDIHHIGSTSVEGLSAKPIIDILLEVHSLEALDAESGQMQNLGYRVKGEFGIPGRRYFHKGSNQRSHHVHAFMTGSSEVQRHLAFRDYLREFPHIRDQYGQLKLEAASLHSDNIEQYMDHKNSFIKHHQQLAMEWQQPCCSNDNQ